MDIQNPEIINDKIRQKTQECDAALKESMASFGMRHVSNDSLTNIKERFAEKYGIISRIRFSFKKSGVFVHKGVGRGTTASQVGSTKRKAEPWFNPVVERFADEMAEELADELVNVGFKNLSIK